VDEILWSQGKVAVELIEEVLEDFGGRRAGGPPKPPREPKPGGSGSGATGGGGAGGGGLAAALAARLGLAGGGAAADSGSGGGGSASEEPAVAGGAAAAAAAAAPGARADEDDLGYRHISEWAFLWTKSVYGIKAARGMGPGQVVSAVAGLNSLTMKKRMIATLKTVRPGGFAGFLWCMVVGCGILQEAARAGRAQRFTAASMLLGGFSSWRSPSRPRPPRATPDPGPRPGVPGGAPQLLPARGAAAVAEVAGGPPRPGHG
jgi:hypothetical protein